jgi:hypothetical protein
VLVSIFVFCFLFFSLSQKKILINISTCTIVSSFVRIDKQLQKISNIPSYDLKCLKYVGESWDSTKAIYVISFTFHHADPKFK